jgi:rRNA pseudouridine-1189 N-methylase Emg1 (Nep1/Mra1 family)
MENGKRRNTGGCIKASVKPKRKSELVSQSVTQTDSLDWFNHGVASKGPPDGIYFRLLLLLTYLVLYSEGRLQIYISDWMVLSCAV